MNSPYDALIRSVRVSTPTRQALEARALPDDPLYVPKVLDAASLVTLRALLARVIPQVAPRVIDLAARIDRQLLDGAGNGWRVSILPGDAAAYLAGLRTLDNRAVSRYGSRFALLDSASQDELLSAVAEGRAVPDAGRTGATGELDHSQLRAWFEDVRGDAVRLFILTPQSLARIGYSGIANGGDGLPKSGFVRVGLDEREDWEPLPFPGSTP